MAPAPVADRSALAGRPTIVSLNPCSDAILAELAPPGQLLAISHFSKEPRASSMPAAQAARYRATSGTAEEVLALAPDVVVADPFLPAPTRAALERSGIRVVTFDIARTLDESLVQMRAMAELAGRRQEGSALARRISAQWEASRVRGDDRIDVLLWQEGGIVPGPDSLAAAMLDHTGYALHSAARGLGQGAYLPLEQVLADPPQLILAAGNGRAQRHPALASLSQTAWRAFDPALLYCAGPTIPRALARLTQITDELK